MFLMIFFDKIPSLLYNDNHSVKHRYFFITGRKTLMQYGQFWIGLIAALIMAGGLGGVFYLIIKQNASLGIKTTQFLAVVLVLPLLLSLGMFGILRQETIGPLVGVIIGYVLSGHWKE
jgi:hypothetical protein